MNKLSGVTNNMLNFDLLYTPDFISVEEQNELRSIALNYFQQGVLEANPRSPNRYRAKIWNTPYCTPFLLQLGDRIRDTSC